MSQTRIGWGGVAIGVVLVAMLALAGPALAHALPQSSDPSAGATLSTPPTQVDNHVRRASGSEALDDPSPRHEREIGNLGTSCGRGRQRPGPRGAPRDATDRGVHGGMANRVRGGWPRGGRLVLVRCRGRPDGVERRDKCHRGAELERLAGGRTKPFPALRRADRPVRRGLRRCRRPSHATARWFVSRPAPGCSR